MSLFKDDSEGPCYVVLPNSRRYARADEMGTYSEALSFWSEVAAPGYKFVRCGHYPYDTEGEYWDERGQLQAGSGLDMFPIVAIVDIKEEK